MSTTRSESAVASPATTTTAEASTTTEEATTTSEAPTTTTAPPPPPTMAPAPPTTVDPFAGETVSQRNARRSAADYLDYPAFSRGGLIEQLEFEGFTPAQAEYGVSTTGL